MNLATIRECLRGPGPFVIRTSDGNAYTVPHSDFIGVTRRYVVLENGRDLFKILDSMHVVSIDSPRPPSETDTPAGPNPP